MEVSTNQSHKPYTVDCFNYCGQFFVLFFLFFTKEMVPIETVDIVIFQLWIYTQNKNQIKSKRFTRCTAWMSPLETAADKVGEHSGHSDGKESVHVQGPTWKTCRLSKRFEKINWLGSCSKEGLLEKKTDCLMAILSASGPLVLGSFPCRHTYTQSKSVPSFPLLLKFLFQSLVILREWHCRKMAHWK